MPDNRTTDTHAQEWHDGCMKWRGHVLTGHHAHYCFSWDGLPVDETCAEWPCGCQDEAHAE